MEEKTELTEINLNKELIEKLKEKYDLRTEFDIEIYIENIIKIIL